MPRTQTQEAVRTEEARQECRVLLVKKTLTFNFYRSFDCAHKKTSLLYTFQRSMRANRNINLWQEKASVQRLSSSKAPKTQQICHYKHTRKTSELFLLFNTGADFSLCNNFANSGSCAKVSVPLYIYNSLDVHRQLFGVAPLMGR